MRLECGRTVEKVGELLGLPTDPDTIDGDGVRSCCTRCELGFDTLSEDCTGASAVTAGLREKIPNTMVVTMRKLEKDPIVKWKRKERKGNNEKVGE